ncbi:MAG: thiamine pyrophosphate-dependent enzyme, partial [Eggerthellaceae bacterium]|nr:thiamine pyrophosphate-dependent enzyme [Eggerthellaceae bacterium]
SIFKLGVTWPIPGKRLREFAESVDKLYVIEEASSYLKTMVRSKEIVVTETPCPLPEDGEISPGLIRKAFGIDFPEHHDPVPGIPARPPALCPGCPHRLVFKELSRTKAIISGDIGCYTLGALPPLQSMDFCVDMGASVSMAHGLELARQEGDTRPVVGVIGDSTFAHSGLSSLISTVYNRGGGTICILDNRTTAMTGRQGNPFNGITLQNRPSRELDLEGVIRSLGVEDVQVINPLIMKDVRAAIKEATHNPDISVLIFRSPCVLLEPYKNPPYSVGPECTACGVCLTLGCPAISCDPETKIAEIDELMCIGCGQCAQYCPFGAIVEE